MTATSHAVIGTVIAAKVGNPALAIPLALASHFVADMVPHWDAGFNWRKKSENRFLAEAVADVIVGFIASYLLLIFLFPSTNLLYAFLLIIASQLPDWLMAPYLFFKSKFPLFRYAYTIQGPFNRSADIPWGIINQVAILILLVVLAKVL